MNPVFVYLIKVNIAIALFLLFYRLFFSNDTLWKTRRIYLLFSILIAFIYPLLSMQQWMTESVAMRTVALDYFQLQELVVTPIVNNSLNWTTVIVVVYLIIVFVLLLKLLLQLFSILRMAKQSVPAQVQGVSVRILHTEITPFSFFSSIYLNPDIHSVEEVRQILLHERTHVQQWHSLDVIIAESICVIFWLNPFSWLLRKEIRQNLEFLADDRVVASGVDSKHYQYHLLQLSCQLPGFDITNKFNISPLKKRIIMMNQPRSSKTTAFKYLLIAPLCFSLVVLSNAETLANSIRELMPVSDPLTAKVDDDKAVKPLNAINGLTVVGYATPTDKKSKTLVKQVVTSSQAMDEDEVFVIVDEMPKYVGGDKALFSYLGTSIRYPVEAQKNGIQGRVICQFVVDTDGKIINPEVVRSVSPELDAEALRVVSSMPAWLPGRQKEKTVKVKYTLPINFALQNNDAATKERATVKDMPVIVLDEKVMEENFDLNSIKPDEIDEIKVHNSNDDPAVKEELIKKYGERAAKGVILISTKKK